MKFSKHFLVLISFIAVFFSACKEKPNASTDDFLEGKELIYFSQESEVWKAKIKDLGSCYAVVDNKENPTWCDIVACSEDLKDFDIELYHKYLFVHFEFSENSTAKNIIAEFYKNKSAQSAGVFDLMLVPKKLELYINNLTEDKISGRLFGQMQSKVNSEDIRDVLYIFKDIPLITTDELK
jgi:hypothetical protein